MFPCRRHKRRRAGKAQGRSLGLPHLRRAQENTRALKIQRTRARHSQQKPRRPGSHQPRRHSAWSECWPETKLRCRRMRATDKAIKMRAQKRTTTKPPRTGREVPSRDDEKFANMGKNKGPSGVVCRERLRWKQPLHSVSFGFCQVEKSGQKHWALFEIRESERNQVFNSLFQKQSVYFRKQETR